MKKPDKNTADFMVQGLDLALAQVIKKCPVSEPSTKRPTTRPYPEMFSPVHTFVAHVADICCIIWDSKDSSLCRELYAGVLISPYPDQEGNKLQRQKILIFICPIYNHNWRNISTIYIYNKTSIKQNILTIEQNTSGSRSG